MEHMKYTIIAGVLLGVILYSFLATFLPMGLGAEKEGMVEDCNKTYEYCSSSTNKIYYSYTCNPHQWVFPC